MAGLNPAIQPRPWRADMQVAKRSGDLLDQKRRARTAANALRMQAHKTLGERAGLMLAQHELPINRKDGFASVSGFYPYQAEINVLPLLARLVSEGWQTALPVVMAKSEPLTFRAWAPGEPTGRGIWDIHIPLETSPELQPDVLLVPMLAFDRRGYRLGYGGGFYDRTLAELRKLKPVVAIGVAYAGQEMDEIPTTSYDEPLDWILTERGVIEPKR
ncbi:MAG: 5-formyltetrahydrofolate cyclo-ligase [Solimonas sp.]